MQPSEQEPGRKVRIGLIGLGTVGTAVNRLLHQNSEAIFWQSGFRFEVARIAVLNLA